jgi:hypothetical protein
VIPWLSTALRIAPWAIAGLALVFGLVERSNYLEERAARAADAAAAALAAATALEADARRTKAIEDAHAAELAKLRDSTNARNAAIAGAPSTDVCVNSPAFRALFDGLRARNATAGPGQPDPAKRAR